MNTTPDPACFEACPLCGSKNLITVKIKDNPETFNDCDDCGLLINFAQGKISAATRKQTIFVQENTTKEDFLRILKLQAFQ